MRQGNKKRSREGFRDDGVVACLGAEHSPGPLFFFNKGRWGARAQTVRSVWGPPEERGTRQAAPGELEREAAEHASADDERQSERGIQRVGLELEIPQHDITWGEEKQVETSAQTAWCRPCCVRRASLGALWATLT